MNSNKKSDIEQKWPDRTEFKRSIRIQFSIYVSGIILLLMLITGYVISDQYVETVTQQVLDKLLVQTRSYSGPAGKLLISGRGPDILLLNNICIKLMKDNQDIYWVGITGKDDNFIAHTDIKQVINSNTIEILNTGQYPQLLLPGEDLEFKPDSISVSVPINENNILVGKLAVTSSTRPMIAAREKSLITVGSITLVMLLIGIPLTMLLVRRKLKPLGVITDHLQEVDFSNLSLEIPIKSKNEFGYLAETMRVMADNVRTAQQELIDNQRIKQELEVAREIQASILPKQYPENPNFYISGTYRSAKEVGGDYYDFIDFDEREMGFLIADVSGKSLPGMLVMLLTRDIVKNLTRHIRVPSELLIETNCEILKNIRKGMFVTMFYGLLNKKNGKFTFASAGHNPLIHFRASEKKCELIKTKGFPLGLMPDKVFSQRIETGEVTMNPGDWLIQYTDGVNEALNSKEEEYGLQRFVDMIESLHTEEPQFLVQKLIASHDEFVGDVNQYDDITIVAINWQGSNKVTSDTSIGMLVNDNVQ